MNILALNDFNEKYGDTYKSFKYPFLEGKFIGILVAAHWSNNGSIHTYWLLENGQKVDCVLFQDTRPKGIEAYPDELIATLEFEKAKSESGRVYLRNITPLINISSYYIRRTKRKNSKT